MSEKPRPKVAFASPQTPTLDVKQNRTSLFPQCPTQKNFRSPLNIQKQMMMSKKKQQERSKSKSKSKSMKTIQQSEKSLEQFSFQNIDTVDYQETIKKIANAMGMQAMITGIDDILTIGQGNGRLTVNKTHSQRRKYSQLLSFHRHKLHLQKTSLQKNQITPFQCLQQQHNLLLSTLKSMSLYLSSECVEKSLLIDTLIKHHVILHNNLLSYLDNRMKMNLAERVQAQNRIEKQYIYDIKQLREEYESLKEEKDRKWKNLFILIKDNRVLRRTKGKLMRQLQTAIYRQQILKQSIIELTKQNQRYKLLNQSIEYQQDGLQKWLKNMASLIKIQRHIQKQPHRTRRVLQYQLQSLQISEMATLPQKIQYIIKAISQAEELVDYYEDLTDLISPSKLLLNNCTQTELVVEDVGVNTVVKQYEGKGVQMRGALFGGGIWVESGVVKVEVVGQGKKGNKNGRRDGADLNRTGLGFNKTMYDKNGSRFLKISRTVHETILPKYIKFGQQKTYIDSRFIHKLSKTSTINLQIACPSHLHDTKPQIKSNRTNKQNQQHNTLLTNTVTLNQIDPNDVGIKHSDRKQSQRKISKNRISALYRPSLNKRYSYNNNNNTDRSLLVKKKEVDRQMLMKEQGEEDKVKSGSDQKYSDSLSSSNTSSQLSNKQDDQIKQKKALKRSSQQSVKKERKSIVSNRNSTNARVHTQPSPSRNLSSFGKNHQQNMEKRETTVLPHIQSGRVSERVGHRVSLINNYQLQRNSQISNRSRNSAVAFIKNNERLSTNLKNDSIDNMHKLKEQKQNIDPTDITTRYRDQNVNKQLKQSLKQIPQHQLNEQLQQLSQNQSKQQQRQQKKQLSKQQASIFHETQPIKQENSCSFSPTKSVSSISSSSDSCDLKPKGSEDYRLGNVLFKNRFNIRAEEGKSKNQKVVINIHDNKPSTPSLFKRFSGIHPIQQQQYQNQHPTFTQQNRQHSPSSPSSPSSLHSVLPQPPQQPPIPLFCPSKSISKLLHLLYQNRKQLKQNPRSLQTFLQINLKNIFGLHSIQSQFIVYSKLLALYGSIQGDQHFNVYVQCFRRMLNCRVSNCYLVDLLKIYGMILDRAGVETMVVGVELGQKVMESISAIFYSEHEVGSIVQQIKNKLITPLQLSRKKKHAHSTSTINLNSYFLILQADLRKNSLETEISQFLFQIVPQNEHDLNYSQFLELTKFLPSNAELQIHKSRIQYYLLNERSSKDTNKANNFIHGQKPSKHNKLLGIKLHKFSLYCWRQKWTTMTSIVQTIEKKFQESMKQTLSLEQLIYLFNQLDKGQYGDIKSKKQCPWLYSLAKQHIQKYKDLHLNLNKHLLMLIWLIQVNIRIQGMGLLFSYLDEIGDVGRRVIVREELGRFLGITDSRKQKTIGTQSRIKQKQTLQHSRIQQKKQQKEQKKVEKQPPRITENKRNK